MTHRPLHTRRQVGLSPAEAATVRELALDGATNIEIARRRGLEPTTIHSHLGTAMLVTRTHTRTALVLWWIRTGQYLA